MVYVALMKAALGEKVPAKPPDSYQATSLSPPPLSLTKMPRSWLKPALAVQRSALALSKSDWLAVGAQARRRLPASISCQLAPSLLARLYWLVDDALRAAGVEVAVQVRT